MNTIHKKTIITFLIFIFIGLSISSVDAQRRRKRVTRKSRTEKPELKESFKDKLWYGSNVNLSLSNSYFVFGLNPMVGYKFNNFLSAGPTIILNYTYQKFENNGTVYNIKSFDYGAGLFTRALFLEQFFVQAEFDYTSQSVPEYNAGGYLQIDPEDPNDILTKRQSKKELFIGLGYHSSGALWGYQATLMYDILEDDTSSSLPITYRLGFTYNL